MPSLVLLLIVLLILTNAGSITEVCFGGIFTGYFYFYLQPASPCITGPWMHRTHSRLTALTSVQHFSVSPLSHLAPRFSQQLQILCSSTIILSPIVDIYYDPVSCTFSVPLFRPLPNNLHALISYFLPPLTSMLVSWRFLLFPEV